MRIEATLVVRRDGVMWAEAHYMYPTKIEDGPDTYQYVAFRDGTGEEASFTAWMALDLDHGTAQ